VEQVMLVSTINADGESHLATKSRASIVTYGPPAVFFFACNAEYMTAKNILETKEFILNIPSDKLVATSWVIGSDPSVSGADQFEEYGLTRIPGVKLRCERIVECQAHFECELIETRPFGPDLAVFGKVVSVSMNERMLLGDTPDRYQCLSPFFFLEAGWTAPMGSARLVDEPVPGPRHDLTILAVEDLLRSVEFYKQVFLWPIKTKEEAFVEFELPGRRRLALCTRDGFAKRAGSPPGESPKGTLSSVQICMQSDDLPHLVARLVGAGAQILKKLERRGDKYESARFADPDGHVIVASRELPPEKLEK
jgi:flavin reductase (DIM6/NTAB) family NADH-FMN oxidoreductase RutF/predicted enzyme related to lactoylglutathione lyase